MNVTGSFAGSTRKRFTWYCCFSPSQYTALITAFGSHFTTVMVSSGKWVLSAKGSNWYCPVESTARILSSPAKRPR